MSEIKMGNKYCPACKRVRDISCFAWNRRQSDGLQIHCKNCHNAKSKQYRKDNPEKCRLYHEQYYGSPRGKYRMLTARARRESRMVEFSLEHFCNWYALQTLNCHYCGRELTKRGKNPESLTIDRLDNAGQYTLRNICLACRRCNTTKGYSFTEHQMLQIAGLYLGGTNKDLAIVDRMARLQEEDLVAIHKSYSAAEHNLIMAGAKAQADKMLKAGWVKEEK